MSNTRLHKIRKKYLAGYPTSFKDKVLLRGYFYRCNFFDDYAKLNRQKYLNRKMIDLTEE